MASNAETKKDLLQTLEENLDEFTAAERAIANFILTNRSGIAFETANSLAEKLQVSATTVGRFCRRMGYLHFKDLKSGLRTTMSGVPWLVGDQITEFSGPEGKTKRSKRSLELELAGIIEVYGIAETTGWKTIVDLLATSRQVAVVGFQSERGVAQTLAHQLQFARDGVSVVDANAGNYHEILAGDPKGRCVVLVDMRRYSEQAYHLAELASQKGMPVIMLTDQFCDWIRKFTPHVVAVPTEVELFWSSPVALNCAVNLLVNDVIGRLGAKVEERLELLSDLYQTFTGHVGGSGRRRVPRS